jgi:hypothetical protein
LLDRSIRAPLTINLPSAARAAGEQANSQYSKNRGTSQRGA